MSLTIEFTPREQEWIDARAEQQGVPPAEVVRRLVDEHLGPHDANSANGSPAVDAENAAAIALLTRWIEEDATDDPEEIRKTREEVEEFKRNMNANRAATGERLVFT